MFGQVTNHENKIFISGQEIVGVESMDVSYSNSYSPSRFVGLGTMHAQVSSEPQQTISMSRYLIYQDPILKYTGQSPISGSVNYQGNSYGFASGFLTDYSINCAVGSIPKINSSISVYSEMKTGISASGSAFPPSIHIPNQGSIVVTCDNSSTNRVVGFDYAIKIPRSPIYKIGSRFASEVVSALGLEFSASVQIDIDEAFLQNSTDFLVNRQNKTVRLLVNSRDGEIKLQDLVIPNASLIGETISSSADGGLKLTLNYAGQI
jgi:hypothetical protein